jgi:hypothetical protein
MAGAAGNGTRLGAGGRNGEKFRNKTARNETERKGKSGRADPNKKTHRKS